METKSFGNCHSMMMFCSLKSCLKNNLICLLFVLGPKCSAQCRSPNCREQQVVSAGFCGMRTGHAEIFSKGGQDGRRSQTQGCRKREEHSIAHLTSEKPKILRQRWTFNVSIYMGRKSNCSNSRCVVVFYWTWASCANWTATAPFGRSARWNPEDTSKSKT